MYSYTETLHHYLLQGWGLESETQHTLAKPAANSAILLDPLQLPSPPFCYHSHRLEDGGPGRLSFYSLPCLNTLFSSFITFLQDVPALWSEGSHPEATESKKLSLQKTY